MNTRDGVEDKPWRILRRYEVFLPKGFVLVPALQIQHVPSMTPSKDVAY